MSFKFLMTSVQPLYNNNNNNKKAQSLINDRYAMVKVAYIGTVAEKRHPMFNLSGIGCEFLICGCGVSGTDVQIIGYRV